MVLLANYNLSKGLRQRELYTTLFIFKLLLFGEANKGHIPFSTSCLAIFSLVICPLVFRDSKDSGGTHLSILMLIVFFATACGMATLLNYVS